MEQKEIINLLDIIEETMIDQGTLGFSPEILAVLDNVDASNSEIEGLKAQIGNVMLMHIFNIANSAYYGTLKKGSIYSFYEVVTRLGMTHTKILIIILALQLLTTDDKEVEVIFARSFASSVVGRVLAQQFGMREDSAKKVEMGALFFEIGKLIMTLYKKFHAPDDNRIDEKFIEKYQQYMAERIISKFDLPDYLHEMIFSEGLVVESNYFTMSGMVQLAVDLVAINFSKFNNHLVIESLPVPPEQDKGIALDAMFEEQFNAVNLNHYLRITRKRERLLPEYEEKKEK